MPLGPGLFDLLGPFDLLGAARGVSAGRAPNQSTGVWSPSLGRCPGDGDAGPSNALAGVSPGSGTS
ncbi:hypothetical protein [Frankia sp. R82]|uniref:hypothetical protein n=1 Tax=Frankia sp. R82 TaxID=2950553 RepID=UPI002042FA6F|nr:hypothetical protein [Frankia sp. R82]MCM3884704.1 hypothetical protein [Frankia sp. R82]